MTIFQIEPCTIAAGDSVPMQFDFVYKDGTLPDFTDYRGYYVLSPYGFENTNVLSKEMTPKGTTGWTVDLYSEDTASLQEGTYTAKVILEHEGEYYKKARGVFNVVKDTDTVEVT